MYQIINQSSYPKALYDTFLSNKATVQKLTYGQCATCFCQVGLSFFPKYTSYKYFWNKLAHPRGKMLYSTAKKFLCIPKFKRHHYFWYSQQPQIEVIQVSIKGWANKTWHIKKINHLSKGTVKTQFIELKLFCLFVFLWFSRQDFSM